MSVFLQSFSAILLNVTRQKTLFIVTECYYISTKLRKMQSVDVLSVCVLQLWEQIQLASKQYRDLS